MSFILDALRKSESERRREAIPDITRIPLAPARLGPPPWIVPVTTLLGVAVIGLAAAWWYAAHDTSPTQNTTPAWARDDVATETRRDGSAAARATAGGGAATDDAPAPADAPDARAVRSERRVVPLSQVAAAPTGAASAAAGPAPDAAATTAREDDLEPAASLPRFAELRARGIALPALQLELHVYSPVPANRFVFVNGARYGEGEALPSGQEVVRITPGGVVLSHAGTRFLLLPD